MTDDEIIDGYTKHVEPGADEHFWAWEAITELIDTDPERAWCVLLLALPRCQGREYIVGSGPLEELLIKAPRSLAERVAGDCF